LLLSFIDAFQPGDIILVRRWIMAIEEITRDILVALLGKINLPAKIGEDKYPAQWAAEAYKLIYKAVAEVNIDISKEQA
jgi:hypothetical protein